MILTVRRVLTSVCLLLVLCNVTVVAAPEISSVEVKEDESVSELDLDSAQVIDSVNQTIESTQESDTDSKNAGIHQQEVRNDTSDIKEPVQIGPLIDIFGTKLLTLENVNETRAQLLPLLTSDALRGKKVIGLYFSADWCGPCRQFTPELVKFYKRMNKRRGKKDEFEIVWVSRCRDVHSFGQYFTQMGGWVALPPEEAMGERGSMLSDKYKVKGIPTLVLLDDLGEVITLDGRNKIPQDKAGVGFPWRNPIATLYITIVPRSLRFLVRSQLESFIGPFAAKAKQLTSMMRKAKPVTMK
jgi:nucleoredoxin